jgi:hypothetical protein
VPVAVVLRPDDSIAARVVAMWESLYVAGIDPALLLPRTEAQVTLAAYPDEVVHRLDQGRPRPSERLLRRLAGRYNRQRHFWRQPPALWRAVAPPHW